MVTPLTGEFVLWLVQTFFFNAAIFSTLAACLHLVVRSPHTQLGKKKKKSIESFVCIMYFNMWFQLLICLWSLLLFLLTLQPSAAVETFILRGLPLSVTPFCRSAPDWGNDTRVNSLLMKGIAAEQMVQQDCKQSFPPKEWILAVNVSPCSEEVISYITTSMSWNLHPSVQHNRLSSASTTSAHSLAHVRCVFPIVGLFFLIKNNGYWPFFSVT